LVAGAAEVVMGFAEGADGQPCRTGGFVVSILLPGPMDEMPGSTVFGVVNEGFGVGVGQACG
jgi:hypothetical protein